MNAETPLTDAYRLLRRVGPPQAPFAGWLARRADGDVVHLVPADALRRWPGLGTASDGHQLGASDVVRCADGHVVEIPWCRERLDRFLTRRRDTAAPLSPGEAVTLAVSILRGTAEATAGRSRDREPRGGWWLTDEGKPVFVAAAGEDAPEIAAATAEVTEMGWHDLDPRAQRALSLASTVQDRSVADAERELFALAEPQPLAMEARQDRTVPAPSSGRAADRIRAEPGGHDPLARYIDADIARLAAESWDRLRLRVRQRRTRAVTRRRRGVWVAAVAAAATVLIAGAVWPDPARVGAEVDGAAVEREPTRDPASAATSGAVSASRVDADGWESAVDAVIDGWVQCADDACRESFLDDPARLESVGEVALPIGERDVTLLDDFGDVAVVRVDAEESTPQIVVVIRVGDALRLRDVYAAQPQ